MAITNTQILDLVGNEKVLGNLVEALLPARNPLITSGLAVRAGEVDAVANGGPRKSSIPFLNPLDSSAYNMASDDITVAGNVGKLTGDEYTVLRHDMNYGFGVSDLTRMVTLYDAKGGIQAGLADYWNGVFQRRATASLKGIQAAVSALTVNILPNTTAFGLDLIIDATVDAGLYADQFDTIIISPVTKGKLQKAEKNSYVPASETNIGFDTWAGFKIIVDKTFGDNMSVVARSGALAFGTGTPEGMVPYEVERVANGGNGQGGDILHSRQSVVIHPQGFNYKATNVSPSEAATAGNLAHSGTWELAVDKEYVPFRFFGHNAA